MLKRLFDVIFAILGIVVLFPLLLLIAILIKFDSKGNILFKQVRVGRYGRLFNIHKFRTMVLNAEYLGLKITVGFDPRVTKIGQFLRKSKLDELPQLWDILIGNMSFVGPRPEVPEYVAYYPQNIKDEILSVRPGITDYASIYMLNESDILAKSSEPREYYINKILPYKLDLALKYINNKKIGLDVYLIFLTIIRIFKRN